MMERSAKSLMLEMALVCKPCRCNSNGNSAKIKQDGDSGSDLEIRPAAGQLNSERHDIMGSILYLVILLQCFHDLLDFLSCVHSC